MNSSSIAAAGIFSRGDSINDLIKKHRDSHRKLLNLMDHLRILLVPERLTIHANAQAAHRMLCHFARLVQVHLFDEKDGLYSPLGAHQNAVLKTLAWHFTDGGKHMRQGFDDYHQALFANRVFSFTSDFLAETLNIFDTLEQHIHLEECTLFPVAERVTKRDTQARWDTGDRGIWPDHPATHDSKTVMPGEHHLSSGKTLAGATSAT